MMDLIKANQANRRQNSKDCVALEYDFEKERDINGAVIELSGRYPESGFAVNKICKELVYVIGGSGSLVTNDNEVRLAKGDMALLQPGDRYFFDGTLTLLISSNPAWYPEQYSNAE